MKSEEQTNQTSGGWLDLTGTAVSWACAVHCLVLPFIISLLPFLGLAFLLDETVEWAIIGASFLIAVLSLLPAYFRRHGKIRSIILFVSGASLIILAHFAFEDSLTLQFPFLLTGAGLITAAHLLNRHLCRSCRRCHGSAKQKG